MNHFAEVCRATNQNKRTARRLSSADESDSRNIRKDNSRKTKFKIYISKNKNSTILRPDC